MNFKTHSIFCIFAINEPKPGKFARSAPKKCYVWYFLSKFPAKHSHFFKYLTPNLQNSSALEKTQGLWGKNSSILRKNSSFLAPKLNEPVVTNYTRYHESVKKKPALVISGQIPLSLFSDSTMTSWLTVLF